MTPTVTQLTEAFFRRLDADVRAGLTKPKTREWYQWQLVKLTRIVGEVAAAELRPQHLVVLTMTHHLARAIRRLFSWAADEEFIPKDPFRKLKIPPCGRRERTLTRSEMVRLYRASPRILRRLLLLMRHTMARPGEIRGLRWEQVHLEKKMIVLTDFKAKNKRKDHASVRVIPLDRVACSFLHAMHRRAGNPSLNEPLFFSRDGIQWSENALRCAMRSARVEAGLEPDAKGERVVCYTMRHTSATVATENGIPQKILSEILGHTRTETTERYQHVKAEHLVSIIDTATASKRGK